MMALMHYSATRLGALPQLDAFQARYGVDCAFGLPSAMRAIDWAQVAQAFAGIIIAPYVWSARLSMLWYTPGIAPRAVFGTLAS